jgi:hypothetical protein
MEKVADLTREHWQGQWADGFHLYNGKMPIVATTLELLREHGPAGPALWRFGREDRQNLWDAIGNPAGTPPSPAALKTRAVAQPSKHQEESREHPGRTTRP